jgi:hypothetical protein
MKWLAAAVVGALASAAGEAYVVERFLSPDRPVDIVIANYLKAVKEEKASSHDLTELAVLVAQKGFPGDAEAFFRMAIKKDKHNIDACYRLGLLLQRQGNDRDAMYYYKCVLHERPGHAQARFMLALAEERRGRRDSAIHDYAKAFHHAPELADPLRNPLLKDSRLQTEAQLLRYQREGTGKTFAITPLDSGALRAMIEAAATQRQAERSGAAVVSQPTPPPAAPRTVSAPVGAATPATAASPSVPPSLMMPAAPAPPPAAQPTPPPSGSVPIGVAPSDDTAGMGRRGRRMAFPPAAGGAATPAPTPTLPPA